MRGSFLCSTRRRPSKARRVSDDNNAAIFTNSSSLVTKSEREKNEGAKERVSGGANTESSVNSTRSRTAIFASLRRQMQTDRHRGVFSVEQGQRKTLKKDIGEPVKLRSPPQDFSVAKS